MQIDSLITNLTLYDMLDVFQVLPTETVDLLEKGILELNIVNAELVATDPDNKTLFGNVTDEVIVAEENLTRITLSPKNFLTDYNDISVEDIRASNSYYLRWGKDYVVENLYWSEDRILGTCDMTLK